MKDLDSFRILQVKQRSSNERKTHTKVLQAVQHKAFFFLGCTAVPFHTKKGTPRMFRFQKHSDKLLSYAQLFMKDDLHEQI